MLIRQPEMLLQGDGNYEDFQIEKIYICSNANIWTLHLAWYSFQYLVGSNYSRNRKEIQCGHFALDCWVVHLKLFSSEANLYIVFDSMKGKLRVFKECPECRPCPGQLKNSQGCIKVPFPPPGGNRIKLLGKKIKWGRREGKREGRRRGWEGKREGNGRREREGKARGKRREREEGKEKGSEREGKWKRGEWRDKEKWEVGEGNQVAT